MTNCFSRLHSPYNDHEVEALKYQLQERLKSTDEAHQESATTSVSEEECRVARNRVAKILNMQEKLIPAVRQLSPPDELLENLERVETYVREKEDDVKMQVRLQGLRKRIHLIYPTWIKERPRGGRLRTLPSVMMQLVCELLHPEEMTSCMLVCKTWMSDVKKNRRVWHSKVLRVYTSPPLSCNPIYREPWAHIALRYVKSVVISCPLSEIPEAKLTSFIVPSHSNFLQDEDVKSTPYAYLLRGFQQGALGNIERLEVGEVCMESFMLICSVLSKQWGLKSVILNSIPAGAALEHRIGILLNKDLQHADILSFDDFNFYFISQELLLHLQDLLLASRSLESLVVPLGIFTLEPQLFASPYHFFMNTVLPSVLSGAPGSVPPIKRLEFRFVGTGGLLTTIINVLRRYGKFCMGDSQLELLKITEPRLLDDWYQHYGWLPQCVEETTALADILRESILRPTSRLRVEIVLHPGNWHIRLVKQVYVAALELLTPEERLLASQRVIIK
jgi:hypothetical protein